MTPSTEAGLAARVEELTHERDHYKRELGMIRDAERVLNMKTRLGLTTQEAAVFDVLLSRPAGGSVEKNALFEAAWGDRAFDVHIKILDVYICKIRQKLGDDVIETIWGTGYRLTNKGRQVLGGAA